MAGTFVLNFTQKVLMLVLTVLLARYMGPHDYGIYASAYAAVVLLCVPASLGLPSLLVRELAAGQLSGEWGMMRGLLTRSTQAILLISLCIAGVLLLITHRLSQADAYPAPVVWLGFALIPLTLLGALRNAVLRGLRHVALGLLPETLIVPALFIAGAVLVHAMAPGALSPSLVVGLRLAATGIAFFVGGFLMWWKLPSSILAATPRYKTGTWMRAAAPMMWVGAMGVITTQTDVLMLASIKGPATAGVYQVASRGAELVAFVSTIATMALQPTLARMFAAGDFFRLKRVTQTTAKFMLGAALAVSTVYVLLGSDLLRKVFGSSFDAALPALLILSAGWVLIAAMGPARDALLMIGGERQSARYMTIAATLNVLLNLLLIPSFGSVGAAVATAASLLAGHGGYVFAVRRRIGFRPSVF